MQNLNVEAIKNLTKPEYFERGLKYFKTGHVAEYHEEDQEVLAKVIGTDEYEVTVDLKTFDTGCTCVAYSSDYICKHIVAVLLYAISPADQTKKSYKLKASKKTIVPDNKHSHHPMDFNILKAQIKLEKYAAKFTIINSLYAEEIYFFLMEAEINQLPRGKPAGHAVLNFSFILIAASCEVF